MQFHILSFEGPDDYSRAGGIATRVAGLAGALAQLGFDTHLWFVGDPALPGHESRGRLTLHRWCQWISRFHPGGVYDGEEGKRVDYVRSLPPFLLHDVLLRHLSGTGERAVVLAEEWHTADAVTHLDWLLRTVGMRDRVTLLWNANNTFGFDRVDWPKLARASTITTVSRYMRHRMWGLGVDPLVITNGIPEDALQLPDRHAVASFRKRLAGRIVLGKVARWDPDKRWLLAIDTVADLKRRGRRPLLIARGGVETHQQEVLERAAASDLRVVQRNFAPGRAREFLESLDGLTSADIVIFSSPFDADTRPLLYRGADAILANSGHEPFGLVGLETMAVGGLACTGGTGEDYVIPGWNAMVLQTSDPSEFARLFGPFAGDRGRIRTMRRRARWTARQHTWTATVERLLLPRLGLEPRVFSADVRPGGVSPGERAAPDEPPSKDAARQRNVIAHVPILAG